MKNEERRTKNGVNSSFSVPRSSLFIHSSSLAPRPSPLFPRPSRLLILFLAVTLLFAWYRHSVCFVWDDSANFAGGIAHTRWARELRPTGPGPDFWHSAEHLWQDAFGYVSGGGYRPLATVYSLLTYWFFLDAAPARGMLAAPSLAHLLFVGTIYGALAVCVFSLARRFTCHGATALFATFLVLASPPLVATSWVVMTGVQAIVPLLVSLALLCYFKMLEPGRHFGARVTLIAILFFGPWFREFLGIVPILIGFLELQRARRPTLWMAGAALSLLHAIYPTALLKMIFFPELPLQPVFAMGNLGGSLDHSEMRWFAAWHFLPLFPPSLLVLAALSALAGSWGQVMASGASGKRGLGSEVRGQSTSDFRSLTSDSCLLTPDSLARRYLGRDSWPALAYSAWLILAAGLLLTGWGARLHGLVLCLGFAVIGLWRASASRAEAPGKSVTPQSSNYILPFWFLAAFLPMLRVFSEHIHFLYAVVPAAFILAREAEACWEALAANTASGAEGPQRASNGSVLLPWLRRRAYTAGARYIATAVLAVITADQAMHLIGAHKVNRATYGGIEDLAEWFKQHVPEGSVVVSNVIHGEEIKWHSGGHFENYWTVAAGVCDGSRVVDEHSKLARLLAGRSDGNVYFLDVAYDYLPSQAGYHRHKFALEPAIPKEFLGLVHRTQTRYFFIDPLRHLVARDYVPFLGAPDLVNDFFTGPPHHRWPFRYEVYAEYRVYRVLP